MAPDKIRKVYFLDAGSSQTVHFLSVHLYLLFLTPQSVQIVHDNTTVLYVNKGSERNCVYS